LSGDRNIVDPNSNPARLDTKTTTTLIVKLGTNSASTPSPGAGPFYTNTMHNLQGNVCMGDGSVQQFTTARLRDAIKNTDDANNLLAFPND
jgi:prepilin-type processing-associated H-X9-DG protein